MKTTSYHNDTFIQNCSPYMVLVGDTKNQTSSSKNTASRASGAFGGRRLYLPPFLSYQKTETSFGFLYSSWFIFQKKCVKTSKMTILAQKNQNRRMWVWLTKLYKRNIYISVRFLGKIEIKNCSRSKTHKSKNVGGGNIYAHKKNWTSRLTGSWVIAV